MEFHENFMEMEFCGKEFDAALRISVYMTQWCKKGQSKPVWAERMGWKQNGFTVVSNHAQEFPISKSIGGVSPMNTGEKAEPHLPLATRLAA